jgi:O-antigen ligase
MLQQFLAEFRVFVQESLTWFEGVLQKKDQWFVLGVSVLGCLIIGLSFFSVFPLPVEYVAFYSVLIFLFSVYRPRFFWLALVFFLPFELPIVAVPVPGVELRLYQWLTVILSLVTLLFILQGSKRIPRLRWFDGALVGLFFATVVSVWVNELGASGYRQLFIFLSFGMIYVLGRIFVVRPRHFWQTVQVFLVSSSVVAGYGLYQAVAFEKSWVTQMVMPGRPNSVFPEADWLGFFLLFALLVVLCQAVFMRSRLQQVLLFSLGTLLTTALIITVSRSAWLGFLCGGLTLAASVLLLRRSVFFRWGIFVSAAGALSLLLVTGLHLTRFQLDERFQSTGGKQEITIACMDDRAVPQQIVNVEELNAYGCQHITLEEQVARVAEGKIIHTVERPDPNVSIRKTIYQKSAEVLRKHVLFGVGPGVSTSLFGIDGRGAGLNSSNLFLEVWLFGGIVGLLLFLVFWLAVPVLFVGQLYRAQGKEKPLSDEADFALCMIGATWVGITVFNLFNAGMFLGSFFLYLVFVGYFFTSSLSVQKLWRQ